MELGDEVITDTHVTIDQAVVTNNGGDGIEYLADSQLRLTPVVGGGQETFTRLHNSSLSVSNSRISDNAKRGIDILNRVGEDSTISIVHNQILSNKAEAIYVLNTASHLAVAKRFIGSSGCLSGTTELVSKMTSVSDQSDPILNSERLPEISPNIELRVRDNVIQSNGSLTGTSTVPILSSILTNDGSGVANTDWTHSFQQIAGTLGGLVIRVGAVDSAGTFTRGGSGNQPLPEDPDDFIDWLTYTANPNWELGLSGIDAEVVSNQFDGNVGADVYVDAFTSQIPKENHYGRRTGMRQNQLVFVELDSASMVIATRWHD